MPYVSLDAVERLVGQSGQADRLAFHLIVVNGSRAVGVHEAYTLRGDSAFLHRLPYGNRKFLSRPGRAGDVVGVVAYESAFHHDRILSQLRSERSHEHCRAGLSEVEPVTGRIVWPARGRTQGLEGGETAGDELAEQVAAHYHHSPALSSQYHPAGHHEGAGSRNAGVGKQQRPAGAAENPSQLFRHRPGKGSHWYILHAGGVSCKQFHIALGRGNKQLCVFVIHPDPAFFADFPYTGDYQGLQACAALHDRVMRNAPGDYSEFSVLPERALPAVQSQEAGLPVAVSGVETSAADVCRQAFSHFFSQSLKNSGLTRLIFPFVSTNTWVLSPLQTGIPSLLRLTL